MRTVASVRYCKVSMCMCRFLKCFKRQNGRSFIEGIERVLFLLRPPPWGNEPFTVCAAVTNHQTQFVSGCAASAAFIKQTATWNKIVYWTSWQIKTKLYVSNMKYGKYGKLCKVLLRHFEFSKFIASHTVQHESNKLGYNSKFDVYFQPYSFFWHSVFRWATSNLF